jgi:hypothetical protein
MPRKKKDPLEPNIRQAAVAHLQKLLPPGTTLYTVKKHTPRNNVGGVFLVLVAIKGEIHNITGRVATAAEKPYDDKHNGVWGQNSLDITQSLSFALHGTDSKGLSAAEENMPHPPPTPARYKSGYSFNYVVLG